MTSVTSCVVCDSFGAFGRSQVIVREGVCAKVPAGGPRRGNVEGAVLFALDAEELALSVHDLSE